MPSLKPQPTSKLKSTLNKLTTMPYGPLNKKNVPLNSNIEIKKSKPPLLLYKKLLKPQTDVNLKKTELKETYN